MKVIETIRHEVGVMWQEIKSNPSDFIESGGLSLAFPRGSKRIHRTRPMGRLEKALDFLVRGGLPSIDEMKRRKTSKE